MSDLDVRPGDLGLRFRPGNSITLELTWPADVLDGRSFDAYLGDDALSLAVVDDVMTITVSAAITLTHTDTAIFRLEEDPGNVLIVGHWSPSQLGTGDVNETTSVVVETAEADVSVAVVGGSGGGAVDSVNGQTGTVVLDASDVGAATTAQGALADTAVQPADLGTLASQDDIAVPGDITATGAPSATTFLRGDGAWATPAGGGSGIVESVVAGSGIDVDATDDANPIVSVESGVFASAAQGSLADTSLQPADIGDSVQAHSAVLDATTASFTTADETKLDGIAAGAEVNVNADWNSVAGDSQILNKPTLGSAAAADTGDFATAAQGATADTAIQPGDAAGGVLSGTYPNPGYATGTQAFTDDDHTKLDGIEAGADVTDAANVDAAGAVMEGDTAGGVLSGTYPNPGYATGTQAFTDGDHTKLDGIEAGADVTDATNVAAAGAVMEQRATFSNANYNVQTTDRYVAQVGTLSAVRTVSLPAASGVAAGQEIVVADESGTVTATNYLVIDAAGSDTIINPGNMNDQAQVLVKGPDAVTLRSNGTDRWMVTGAGVRRPFCWWMNNNDVAIPSGVWVPHPWNAPYSGAIAGVALGADEFGVTPDLQGTTTTVAAGSDAAVLPQATINVASTAGFTSNGYITITGPPGSGDDTIVSYTGVTGTSFTGCNSAYRGGGVGISTGTLATGQVVRQANVEYIWPTGYLWNTILDIAFDNIATTAYFGLRYRSIDNFFNFSIATQHHSGINISNQHGQMSLQPGVIPSVPGRIEVFQNSGVVKLSKVDGIQAPSLMQAFMSDR